MAMDQLYTDTLKELEQVKEDRDSYKRMFAAACETIGAVQEALGSEVVGIEPVLVQNLVDERDALAAHLEELGYLIVDAKRCAAVLAFPLNYNATDYQNFAKDVMSTIEALSKKEPIASLARRDLIKQAELLDRILSTYACWDDDSLEAEAKDLRQQAEALK